MNQEMRNEDADIVSGRRLVGGRRGDRRRRLQDARGLHRSADVRRPPITAVGAADACACEKYCQVVCEMKEVKKHVWVVKCEDFCRSAAELRHGLQRLRRVRGLQRREDLRGRTRLAAMAAARSATRAPRRRTRCYVPPKCGKVREKKTLEKKEVVCKVPSYKCVVVYCCPNCGSGQNCEGDVTPAAPKAPTAPSPAPAKTTIRKAPMPPVLGAAFVK